MRAYFSLRLGDNDYCNELKDTLTYLHVHYGAEAMCAVEKHKHLKAAVIELMLGYLQVKNAMRGWTTDDLAHTREYLHSKLQIIIGDVPPRWDTDSGTASIDLHRGYQWMH